MMPFVAGGALQQLLRKKYPSGVNEDVLVTIARDVLQGLDYLHRHSCMHRDLKVPAFSPLSYETCILLRCKTAKKKK